MVTDVPELTVPKLVIVRVYVCAAPTLTDDELTVFVNFKLGAAIFNLALAENPDDDCVELPAAVGSVAEEDVSELVLTSPPF